MSLSDSLHADRVYRVLEEREQQELRFRSAMITSTAMHTGVMLAILIGPLFIPAPVILDFTPVNMVRLDPTPPAPTPAPVEEEQAPEPEPEPEPEEIEPPPPEDVPEDLEAQRQKEEEEAARLREEERQRREALEAQRKAEEDRQKALEEAERQRQLEEDARRAPQEATRETRPPQQSAEVVQQAERGEMGMQFGEELSAQDLSYLDFWINRVLTNISSKWEQASRPAGSREIVAIVHFRVGRNGRFIVDPDILSTSGDRRYDAAAVRAVLGGQPFPPLPQSYSGNTLAINLAFRQ